VTFLALGVAGTGLASSPTNSTSTITDVEPGLLGFLVVAALAVALVFLLRSMNKQFRKIGPRPADPESAAEAASGEEPSHAQATDDETDGAVGVGLAALTESDTGVGFVPDTGPKSGRRGGS
jgi:hypothetical protein